MDRRILALVPLLLLVGALGWWLLDLSGGDPAPALPAAAIERAEPAPPPRAAVAVEVDDPAPELEPAPDPFSREGLLAGVRAAEARLEAEADARLEVVILQLPESARAWTKLQVYRETAPGSGQLKPGSSAKPEPVGEEHRATIGVPSNRRLRVDLSGAGVRWSGPNEPLVLAPGETRRLEIDLGRECSLRVRLTGVDGRAMAGRPLSIRYLRGGSEEVASPAKRPSWASAATDAEGQATFLVPTRQHARLELAQHGGWRVPLVDARTGQDTWDPCLETEVEVVPRDPLVAVGLVDREGRWLEALAFSLAFDDEPGSAPEDHPGGLALVSAQRFERSATVRIATRELGVLGFPTDRARRLGAGLVAFELGDPSPLQGSLRVRVRGDLPIDVAPRLLAVGGDERPVVLVAFESPPRPSAEAGEEGVQALQYTLVALADGYLFRKVPPGRYRFHWFWMGAARADATVFAIRPGEETLLDVEPLALRRVRGRVLDWETIPALHRPFQLRLDGGEIALQDGRFEAQLAFPPDDLVVFHGPGMFVWSARHALEWDEQAGELLVRCPADRLATTLLRVPPLHAGVVKAKHFFPAADPREPDWGARGHFVQPRETGEVAIVQLRGTSSDALVNEFVPGGSYLRGWLRLGGQDTTLVLPMPGRMVTVEFDRPGAMVQLRAEGPSLAGGALPEAELGTVGTGAPATVWLPDEAAALLVDPGHGEPLRVPLGVGDTRLAVSLP